MGKHSRGSKELLFLFDPLLGERIKGRRRFAPPTLTYLALPKILYSTLNPEPPYFVELTIFATLLSTESRALLTALGMSWALLAPF